MNAVVMLAGGFSSTPAIERAVREADLVVAADGGADHLKALDVAPGLLVGDLDSITGEHRTELEAQGVEIVRHPQDKDATDAELALLATLDRGATAVTILGGRGGPRADHETANLLLLAHPRLAAVDARFLTATTEVRAFGPGDHRCVVAPRETISLVPITAKVRGVTLAGVRWPLAAVDLKLGSTYTLSNRATGPEVALRIGDGVLLFFHDLSGDGTEPAEDRAEKP